MNTPNKLTLLRIVIILPFVAFMLVDGIPHRFLWAFAAFVTASLTDMLDGYLARKHDLVTDFGILMDPLADKLLVTSALICFVGQGMIPPVVAIIILSREFLVTSIRLVAAPKGRVIPADKWGKSKTICQMIWISYLLIVQWAVSLGVQSGAMVLLGQLLMSATTVLTVFSGGNYLLKNADLLKG
ncbi:MAG: CDP-diacylglycerol--glycerol-3-phosphate 3-phosphatidyltransferase [Clostridiales bacterium]|nr:CDP-diacylglycerol--glycerol-3-phosphate 3-phosphatidyltransferase [Clostridiales bacterium]